MIAFCAFGAQHRMGWFIITHIFATIFSFSAIDRLSDWEKDLEILLLRQQLAIL